MMHRTASVSASAGRVPAIISVVSGAVGLVSTLIEPTLTVLLGIAGLVLGVVATRRSARGVARVGVVLNAALLLLVVLLVATTTGTRHGSGFGT
jgi:fumarate reductase subunit D